MIITTVLACIGKWKKYLVWLRNGGDWYCVWKENWLNEFLFVDHWSRVKDPEKGISCKGTFWADVLIKMEILEVVSQFIEVNVWRKTLRFLINYLAFLAMESSLSPIDTIQHNGVNAKLWNIYTFHAHSIILSNMVAETKLLSILHRWNRIMNRLLQLLLRNFH